jgi:ATP-dependent Clp protease ATP-binding subunit ClpC
MTGVPLTRLSSEDAVRLLQMENELHKRSSARTRRSRQIAKAVRRSRSGLKDPKRPTGCFLSPARPASGKTLLAKALAEFMFGDEEALVQIDMSEYMEKHNVSRLIGAPPGYVGYEEGGQLTEKIRRRPYSVVLLDEIEKAHPDVFNMLLQIMEEGHLTDSFGRKVDFRNVVLIMTTNAGADVINQGDVFGFAKQDDETSYEKMKERLKHVIEREFKPEFIGRIDEVVVFRKLTRDDLKHIVDIELSKVYARLAERGLKLELTDEAREFIIDKGGDTDYGARPLRRSVSTYIEDPLSEEGTNAAEGELVGAGSGSEKESTPPVG